MNYFCEMNWKQLINEILRDFRISDTELSQRTGITQPTIFKLRKGLSTKPNAGTVKRLEEGLNIRINDSDTNNISYTIKVAAPSEWQKTISNGQLVPLLSNLVHGGESLMYSDSQYEGKIFVPGLSKTDGVYSIRVKGNSMNDKVHEGDIVVIDIYAEYKNGDIVVCRLKSGEQYVKRFRKLRDNLFQLYSDNASYEPITVSTSEIEIINKVIAIVQYM